MKLHRTLVTGATGGIGLSLCHYLASKGHELVLSARNVKKLNDLKDSLVAIYPDRSFSTLPFDFGTPREVISINSILEGRPLNGMVVMPPQVAPTEDCLPQSDVWQNIFNESFMGPLELLKLCLPSLIESGKSKVVMISGISSAQVLSHYATSNVLRAMWLAQSKTLSVVHGPQGIHINTLSLGGVMTEKYNEKLKTKAKMSQRTFEDQMALEVSNIPLRKYASPDDVAKAVEGLLGDFSDHFTGMNFLCDGGFTRAY